MSSAAQVWSVLQQFQLLILLLLLAIYIPADLFYYFSGLDFTMFNLNFVPTIEIPGIKKFIAIFNFDTNLEGMKAIEAESGSAFVNNYSWVLSILGFITLNIVYSIYFKKYQRPKGTKVYKFQKGIKRLLEYNIYVRTIVESLEMLLI